MGNSLVVQCLGLQAFSVKGLGSIPCWGTVIPQAMQLGEKKKNENKEQLVRSKQASGNAVQNLMKNCMRGKRNTSEVTSAYGARVQGQQCPPRAHDGRTLSVQEACELSYESEPPSPLCLEMIDNNITSTDKVNAS